jgi:hypothetical protein
MNIQPLAQQEIRVPQAINNGIANVGESINNIKTGISTSLNQFSEKTQAGIGASSEFLKSNTIVAKIAFILLVLILFLFLMNLGIMLISYFTQPATKPYLINGMISGSYPTIVTQDPNNKTSLPIQRSNNQSKGMEFTWSFWLYINDLGDGTKAQNIFNKGSTDYDSLTGIAKSHNSPGVYLTSTAPQDKGNFASIKIIMNTALANDEDSNVTIDDIPIRKWVHVVIRMQNTIMDTYINGMISNRKILNNTPKQNYYDINLFQNGGFNGSLSNLRYYSYALNVFEINSVVAWGPNTNTSSLSSSSGAATGNYNYLSNSWYSSKL